MRLFKIKKEGAASHPHVVERLKAMEMEKYGELMEQEEAFMRLKMLSGFTSPEYFPTVPPSDAIAGITPLPSLVEQIHSDFVNEINREVETARSAKFNELPNEEIVELEQKAKILESLGFRRSKNKEDINAVIRKNEMNIAINKKRQNLIEAVEYFSKRYPLYKLIGTESIKQLCGKYNLSCYPNHYYVGSIPEKNIVEILNFKIEKEDKATKHFVIAAPLKDFDTNALEFDNLLSFEDRKTLERSRPKARIDDPIVFQPTVYKGESYCLIVTMWGEEASDAELNNPKMN